MDVDELYALPADRFVAERDALAKALRADGDREGAAEVAALRKPSVAAAAANHLARAHAREVGALLDAGAALRGAQESLLAGKGGDARTLRAARDAEREAVDALLALAGELSAAVAERVAATLHAAALDEAAGEQLRAGRLERELQHAGLGLGDDVAAVFTAPAARSARPARSAGEGTAKGRGSAKRGTEGKAAGSAGGGGASKGRGPTAKGRGSAGRGTEGQAAGSAGRGGTAKAADAAERRAAAQERKRAEQARRERIAARKQAAVDEKRARRRSVRAMEALSTAEERRAKAAEKLAEADAALADAQSDAQAAHREQEHAEAVHDELKQAIRTS